MKTHNFVLCGLDTDSILFCKPDQAPFTIAEQEQLLLELNSLYPENIKFEDDGYFSNVLILKAKNYCLKTEDGKIKIKGSALKATTKERALKELINQMVDLLLNDRAFELKDLYKSYIKEACNIKDITRWSSKKTITEAVLNPQRTNEQKVADALKGTEFSAGDKRYFFFKNDDSLSLQENFDGDYNKDRMLEKVYNTFKIFENVVDMSQILKYHLKRHKKDLEELLNEETL